MSDPMWRYYAKAAVVVGCFRSFVFLMQNGCMIKTYNIQNVFLREKENTLFFRVSENEFLDSVSIYF